jgi:hypothetical protein
MSKLSIAFVAACLIAVSISAPAMSADLAGVIVDQDGHAIPGATITTQSPNGRTIATATSDSQGQYTIDGLNAGEYFITLGAPGVQTQSQTVASYVGGNGLAVNWLVTPGVVPLASAQPLTEEASAAQSRTLDSSLRLPEDSHPGPDNRMCFRKSDKLFCDNGRDCRTFPYGFYYCHCCDMDRFD